jgi:hypothetical protein
MSSVKPIIVDSSLPAMPESRAVYSKHWQALQTGQMLLAGFLPTTINNAEIVVLDDPPPSKERITEPRVAAIRMIPSEALALEAYSMLQTAQKKSSNPWGIHVAGIGSFTPGALGLLVGAAQTRAFVDKIKEVLRWMSNEPDTIFVEWFRSILLDTPGVMTKSFQSTTGISLAISSALDLRMETYVDDETVRVAMELFSESYGANGQYLFIPPIQIQLWQQNLYKEWRKSDFEGGKVKKAFAVVHMPGHWGAIEVDFVRRSILFGDSLSFATPTNTIEAVRDWISCCGLDMSQWNSHVKRFDVPQQPGSSGSCALNALNAIEREVNRKTERWTHLRSAYHRLRLLKLVTGFSKVCPFTRASRFISV